MKRHVIFLLPLLPIACNSAEPEQTTEETVAVEMVRNNWQNEHLKGEVKTITETPYQTDATGALGEMDSCCIVIYEYDNLGYKVKVTEKNFWELHDREIEYNWRGEVR